MATHSSTLLWRIPWTEEPGELQSMGSKRVGHAQTLFTHLSLITLEVPHHSHVEFQAFYKITTFTVVYLQSKAYSFI